MILKKQVVYDLNTKQGSYEWGLHFDNGTYKSIAENIAIKAMELYKTDYNKALNYLKKHLDFIY